jgi:hypothetical protein
MFTSLGKLEEPTMGNGQLEKFPSFYVFKEPKFLNKTESNKPFLKEFLAPPHHKRYQDPWGTIFRSAHPCSNNPTELPTEAFVCQTKESIF